MGSRSSSSALLVAEWILEGAISKVPARPMSMRWVLTWKPSDEHPQGRKGRSRIAVLGNQHSEIAEFKMASPTLSRPGKILSFQWTAFKKAELECVDAKSASLQSDGHEMQDA